MKVLDINPQYIKDTKGQTLGVFLSVDEFEKMLTELEDYEDTKAYDEAKSRKDQEFIPLEQALDEIKKGHVE